MILTLDGFVFVENALEHVPMFNEKIDKKHQLDVATKHQRQDPSSNYPIKFLSPTSQQKRRSILRNERLRLKETVRKYYIELPENQSTELCMLIEAIEESKQGKDELKKITAEGK